MIRTSAICPLCDRAKNLTSDGRLYQHRAWRINKNGQPYPTQDSCQASGLTPEEAAR
jgi:hypothetical protein